MLHFRLIVLHSSSVFPRKIVDLFSFGGFCLVSLTGAVAAAGAGGVGVVVCDAA